MHCKRAQHWAPAQCHSFALPTIKLKPNSLCCRLGDASPQAPRVKFQPRGLSENRDVVSTDVGVPSWSATNPIFSALVKASTVFKPLWHATIGQRTGERGLWSATLLVGPMSNRESGGIQGANHLEAQAEQSYNRAARVVAGTPCSPGVKPTTNQ
jgi:hypothetical protein